MTGQDPARSYRTLDGLRGVAALVVVTRHSSGIVPYDACPESFLAVDLFFLLSGFVIAHAYETRLRTGGWLAGFMRVRLIRLYPLYTLGLGLGLVGAVASAAVSGHAPDAGFLLKASVIGLLLLPAVPPLPVGSSTLDGPTWTLAPELLANLVYAVAVRRLTARTLCIVVALGAVAVAVCEYRYGTLDGGWYVATFPVIGARLAFSFFLGVLMHRLKPQRRTGSLAAWACLSVLAAILAVKPPDGWGHAFEIAAVLAVFPALVWAALHREPGRGSGAVFGFLGAVSYAVYVLHQPMGVLTELALEHGLGRGLPQWAFGMGFMFFVVAAGALADRVYDRPVRRWLIAWRATPGSNFKIRAADSPPPRSGGGGPRAAWWRGLPARDGDRGAPSITGLQPAPPPPLRWRGE